MATPFTAQSTTPFRSGIRPIPPQFQNPAPRTEPSAFVRIGVPIIVAFVVMLVFLLVYLAAYELPDSALLRWFKRKRDGDAEDRQVFLAKRRNSLVKRLKRFKDTAKKNRESQEYSAEVGTALEVATPYPGDNGESRDPQAPGRFPRMGLGCPQPVAAAPHVDIPTISEEVDVEEDPYISQPVNRGRPVAFVKPISPRIIGGEPDDPADIFKPVDHDVIKVDIHQPHFSPIASPYDVILGKGPVKAGSLQQLSDIHQISSNPLGDNPPDRTSTPVVAVAEQILSRQDRPKPTKSTSMQNLSVSPSGWQTRTIDLEQPNAGSHSVFVNRGFEPDDGHGRRAQSMGNIAFKGPLAAGAKDISV